MLYEKPRHLCYYRTIPLEKDCSFIENDIICYIEKRLNKKANHIRFAFEEASRGFEPLMRILQTLALPLGHDAIHLH